MTTRARAPAKWDNPRLASAVLKRVILPCLPIGALSLLRQRQLARECQEEAERKARFDRLRGSVLSAVSAIRSLTLQQCADVAMLEHELIPALGLNDENLQEQPPELSPFFGRDLHIWQYPCQLAPYLVWLSENAASVTTYMEIGCRWGGTFVLVSEWLRKIGADLKCLCAIDPIEPTPFIEEYFKMLREEASAGASAIEPLYLRALSTSDEARQVVERIRPDFVFIDGDHTLEGALSDHMLVRDNAEIIVHHDVYSTVCPGTTQLWAALKTLERYEFEAVEFVAQYDSVPSNYLGIGALKRIRRSVTR
jgi:hypothetical protein